MKLTRNELILKLNEVYHDLENQAYDDKHPDILEMEMPRWHKYGKILLEGDRTKLNILDFGTGTGFVPLQLMRWLKPEDKLTCADLSSAMLNVCDNNLKSSGVSCQIVYLKINNESIPIPDQSQDIVTVNAVLHHLSRPEILYKEISRILKPGGRLIIGHEPNRSHFKSRFLVLNYWVLLPFVNIKLFAYEIILRLGLFELLRTTLGRFIPELNRHNTLFKAVNDKMLLEGYISKPMPAAMISELLDAQSPTAGGIHSDRGFAREDFEKLFSDFKIVHFETYKHLRKIDPNFKWLHSYENWLQKKFPDYGSDLFCYLIKNE